METKKLIIFMPSIEGGGADKNLFIISNYLVNKFKNVHLITSSLNYKKKFDSRVNFITPKMNIWSGFGRNLKYLISVIILIKTIINNRNLIVLSFQANLYAILICKILSVKIITRSNSFPGDWSKSVIMKFLFKYVYKMADARIVNSIGSQKKFLEIYNLKSKCIYNPLNLKEIIKLSKNKTKNYFDKTASLKLISVGRLSKEKDHLTLLRSALYLKNKLKISVLILGEGLQKQNLIKFINNNKLTDVVKLIGYKKNPYPFIKKTNFLILTSLHEGLPNILLEATALKKFVISSDCETGPREILLNGKAGGLFKVSDYLDLSRKILFFNKNKKITQNKVMYGYSRINRFNIKSNLEKYFDTIYNVIKN